MKISNIESTKFRRVELQNTANAPSVFEAKKQIRLIKNRD